MFENCCRKHSVGMPSEKKRSRCHAAGTHLGTPFRQQGSSGTLSGTLSGILFGTLFGTTSVPESVPEEGSSRTLFGALFRQKGSPRTLLGTLFGQEGYLRTFFGTLVRKILKSV